MTELITDDLVSELRAPRTLRPGLVVVMKSGLGGGVTYNRKILDKYIDAETGAEVVIWDTKKVTVDPVEHAEAIKVRTLARGRILRVTQITDFGLMARAEDRARVSEEIKRAKEIVAEFNARARTTRIDMRFMVGVVAADDVEAVESIAKQVRSLLADMQTGLQRFDADAIRAAANEAQTLGQLLTDDARERLQGAIDAARKSARQIVKAGETAAKELDRAAFAKLDTARVAFLDFAASDGADLADSVPTFDAVGIDFEPLPIADAPAPVSAPVPTADAFALDF
jgi:alkanesulfonate monooxygenase SsuD/methylene tetrahydromethanopterin reductase-like flavin-dependent oxidoreductase (luciferase family)